LDEEKGGQFDENEKGERGAYYAVSKTNPPKDIVSPPFVSPL
jgi:hypothetical protein